VISNSRDGVGSDLVADLGGSIDNRLDHGMMSNSPNSSKCSWSSQGSSVGEDGTVEEDLRLSLSLSLLPLSNHGLRSSSWSSQDGETMVGEGVGSIASVGHGVSGVSDVREDWGVVDERGGGGHHSAGSSEDGGLSISGPLAVVTVAVAVGVTVVTSVASVAVAVISVVSISIGLRLGISRSLAVVTEVWVSVVTNSDGVSGHLVLNLGGSDHVRLDNWNMSNSPNSGSNVWERSSTIQELGVSLSSGEGEES